MLNGDPVLSDLDSSDRLILLKVINKVVDMTEMSVVDDLFTSQNKSARRSFSLSGRQP